jgi:hypothetical protein
VVALFDHLAILAMAKPKPVMPIIQYFEKRTTILELCIFGSTAVGGLRRMLQ